MSHSGLSQTAPSLSKRLFKRNWILVCLLLVAATMFLWKLGVRPLKNWDEAIYAQVAKETFQTGDWLTLHWDGQPWFEKPPLYIWMTAAFYRVFGVNEFAARLASALGGVGLIGATFLIGRQLYGPAVGVLGSIILLTEFQIVQGSRLVMLDVLMTFFVYAAIYFYIRALNDDARFWYLVSTAAALAFLTKAMAGLIAPTAIGIALMADGHWKETLRKKHFWLSWLMALLIVTPWHVVMYVMHGSTFISEYVGYHMLARTFNAIEGHKQDYLYYWDQFVEKFKPWWILAPAALALSVYDRVSKRQMITILAILVVLVFAVCTAAQTRLGWYITPIYPAMSILVAYLLVRIGWRHNVLKFAVAGFCIWGTLFAIGKLTQPYETTDKLDSPLKLVALAAQRKGDNDNESLIVFESEKHAPIFYSGRRVEQATTKTDMPKSQSARRYVDFKPLAELTDHVPRRILIERGNLERLAVDYDLTPVAEADAWLFAFIRKRSVNLTNQTGGDIQSSSQIRK